LWGSVHRDGPNAGYFDDVSALAQGPSCCVLTQAMKRSNRVRFKMRMVAALEPHVRELER
jgi:hypothetical protein